MRVTACMFLYKANDKSLSPVGRSVVSSYRYTDTGEPTLLLFHYLEYQILANKFLILSGKIALKLKQETGQCVCLAHILGIIILIKPYNPEKVRKKGLTLKDVCIRPGLAVTHRVIVKLIIYFTEYFLNHVLKCHQSGCAAELIHDNGQVYATCLEIMQQVIDLTGFGNEESRMSDCQRNPSPFSR